MVHLLRDELFLNFFNNLEDIRFAFTITVGSNSKIDLITARVLVEGISGA